MRATINVAAGRIRHLSVGEIKLGTCVTGYLLFHGRMDESSTYLLYATHPTLTQDTVNSIALEPGGRTGVNELKRELTCCFGTFNKEALGVTRRSLNAWVY